MNPDIQNFVFHAKRAQRRAVDAFVRPRRSGLSQLLADPASSAWIVAAHPDDDVIGAGVLMSRLKRAGVIFVTDGAPRDGIDASAAGFDAWQDYAQRRKEEASAAIARSGAAADPVIWLDIPDAEAAQHMASLTERLVEEFAKHDFGYVFTHAFEGGHPDHDATAFAVARACRILERSGRRAPVRYDMAGYHRARGWQARECFIPNLKAGREEEIEFVERERAIKAQMFAAHETQDGVLHEFSTSREIFRRSPNYDFQSRPHLGPLFYETFKKPVAWAWWKSLAREADKLLGLRRDADAKPAE